MCRATVTGSMFSGPAGPVWSAPVRVRNPNSVITTGLPEASSGSSVVR